MASVITVRPTSLSGLLFLQFLVCQILSPQATGNQSGPQVPREVTAWLENAALPLESTSPKSGLDDLRQLQSTIGNAHIVAMGEATHGTREFFQLKHRMLEFLVEKMGFTAFGIEANWPESLAVNDYVLNGNGDPAQALAGLYFWTWNTEEVLDLNFHVGYHHSQHLFVDINSRYSVRHKLLLAGSGERAAVTLTRVAGYRRSPREDNDAQLFTQTRTLRIRH